MKGFIIKLRNYVNKIGKINFVLVVLVMSFLVVMGIVGTFALFNDVDGVTYSENSKTYKFIIGEDNTQDEVIMGTNDSKYIDISIINNTFDDILYALYYECDDKDVLVGVVDWSTGLTSDTLKSFDTVVISLKIINNSSTNVKVTFGIDSGLADGGELKKSGTRISEKISNLDSLSVNEPNLDNGLIPVYYDEEVGSWYKADSTNSNPKYKWYDYSIKSKMWANAVQVTDDTRLNYLNSHDGVIINSNDILAFYVWVPRFKYRVWNVSRSLNDIYSYDALGKGIDIQFEKGTNNSGNLSCIYNSDVFEGNFYNDDCNVDNSNIVIGSKNSDYTNLWYTHPAFSYGNTELSGFWVAKYEVSGTGDMPKVIPDDISLKNLDLDVQFTISKKFSEYGLGKDIESHMMKNTEWGAVSYLIHSLYGVCTDSGCRDVYFNNSKLGHTGRSLGTVYSDNKISNYGTYSYDGYLLDDSGIRTGKRDISKIASSTSNIYGIYDMVSSTNENVMGNMVNSSKNFNVGDLKGNWDGTKVLGLRYFDSYAYGISGNNNAYNRTMLGDATGEVTSNNGSWYNKSATFVNNKCIWFVRGGNSTKGYGLFGYECSDGKANKNNSFRNVLS